jgi:hypothetical protein
MEILLLHCLTSAAEDCVTVQKHDLLILWVPGGRIGVEPWPPKRAAK